MSLVSLNDDLILLICIELPLADITSLRQTCRVLCQVTRSKILWINLLERYAHEGKVLPPYIKGYALLDAGTLEALAHRVSRLSVEWEIGALTPVHDWRLDLPQSITWLRLVAGIWLFVASSDNHISKITCWDLSLVFQGSKEPLAEAYLPGQVKTGEMEMQDSGVVLALGLGSESLATHVVTLRKHAGGHVFSEHRVIEGSSHVLMLCGNFIGCALRRDAIAPHIIDWKDGRVLDIPGGLDVPGRRSIPHLMTISKNILIIVRATTLEVYTLPLAADDSVVLVKLVNIPTVWEVAVCKPMLKSLPHISESSLRLIVFSPVGVEICVIDLDTLHELDDQPICLRFPLAKIPSPHHRTPWYRLCIGEGGRRSLWVSAPESGYLDPPHLVYMGVPQRAETVEMPRIIWNNDGPDHAALWAQPVLDFDEALGLTVLGNCFGELAIYDHVGQHPEKCTGLADDFTDQQSALLPILPRLPISLGLSITPVSSEFHPSVVSGWSQDDIDFGENWRTDWEPVYTSGYWDWDQWQGVSCDWAWILEHAYGFPGRVLPQAYEDDRIYGLQRVLLRLGNRYLTYTIQTEHDKLRSWPVVPMTRQRYFHINDSQPELPTCKTAMTEGTFYKAMFTREMQETPGKNRWIEQAERGGRPHANLLVMLPADDDDDDPLQ
ncbi:hypothetical protein DFH07DRAFT_957522 [Mycena maculata]|uniref:F-box domain-containing protein n=1 Tax=Mycena maculata TaxID=230809 RepID=A0AAD7JAG6_9AGAR|nr:hypothetical protein DFH07DRAFT_957522 [Mycena maculata]